MTDYPQFGDNWPKRWVQCGRGRMLHRLAWVEREEWDEEVWGPGVSACGIERDFHIPGFISRLGVPRCPRCCRVVGVPVGKGSPTNDKAITEAERAL